MTVDVLLEDAGTIGGRAATAPLGRRLLAMTYEAMLLFAVVFVAGYLFDTLTQSRQALMFRHFGARRFRRRAR